MTNGKNPKLPLVKILSDDCVVMVGEEVRDGKITVPGTPYKVHEGEWVLVLPTRTMNEYLALSQIATISSSNNGQASKTSDAFDELCERLADRVVEWNWTDMMGEPLPQPYKRSDVIKALSNHELIWLVFAAKGETQEMRKNASSPLRNTSSTRRSAPHFPQRAS